jgi:hypothetical protein
VVTDFDVRVMPRFRYARAVIVGGLRRRRAGQTWERAAAASTANGQLDASTLKRWHRRFRADGESLVAVQPPVVHYQPPLAAAILGVPAASRSPKPSQEDPWARSPPQL